MSMRKEAPSILPISVCTGIGGGVGSGAGAGAEAEAAAEPGAGPDVDGCVAAAEGEGVAWLPGALWEDTAWDSRAGLG